MPDPAVPPNPDPAAPPVDADIHAAEKRRADEEKAKREAAEKKYADLQAKREEEERERLQEEGKWKELAESEKRRADEAAAARDERLVAAQGRVMTAELRARLALEGVDDLDFHVLADRTKLSVNEKGDVVGLEECVADLKARKPAIFGNTRAPSTTRAGAPPPPSGRGTGTGSGVVDVSKMSPEEYRAYKNKTLGDLRRRRA